MEWSYGRYFPVNVPEHLQKTVSDQTLFEPDFLNDFCEKDFFKVCSEHESRHLFICFN